MLKFLFFDFNIPFLLEDKKEAVGGASVQTMNWINGLLKNKNKVGVLIEKGSSYPKVSPIDFRESFNFGNKNSISWFYPRLFLLNKSIKKYAPDYIIQAGAGFVVLPLAIIARLNGVKFIHRIANNVDIDNRIFIKISKIGAILYRIGLSLTPIISCQNEYQYDKLKKRYPKKDIIKVVNPFNCSTINNNRSQ